LNTARRYRPRYRDVNYLTDLLKPLFKGQFVNQRGVQAAPGAGVDASKQVPPGSAAAMIDKNADLLVFNGEHSEIVKLSKLLLQLDVATGEVLARAALYEVTNTNDSGSAWQLAASILSSKLSISIGANAQVLDNAVRIKTSGIDAVLSALATDSRFKVVSSPSIRVRSGSSARFSVGQEVPVLGAVTYPGSGQQPVQSVEYRPSGVIFELTPQVRDATVDCSLSQQVSNFVNTTTGVNNSPTLIKRELKTDVSLADGDVIILGGMTETKDSGGSAGISFLPAFMRSKTESSSKSEIILVLQLTRI
jgi:type II secretory pathway component GspD/PulD (secretin)